MPARRGLARSQGAGSLACLAVLSALVTTARAETLIPLERSAAAPGQSGGGDALIPPFAWASPSTVMVDVGRRIRPIVGWHLQLALQLDYLDLPLIPARGPGMVAFLGTSTQSLGGFRLHF